MKKINKTISSPEELNKSLQYSSPITWIILGLTILLLVGLFSWSIVYKLKLKISGQASVNKGIVSLKIDESSLDKLKTNQKVYIANQEGFIVSIDENKQPVVSGFNLIDGEYEYEIVLDEIRPINFLFG